MILTVTSGRASPSILAEIVRQYEDSRVPAYSPIEPQLIRSCGSAIVNEVVSVFVTQDPCKFDNTASNIRLPLLGAM